MSLASKTAAAIRNTSAIKPTHKAIRAYYAAMRDFAGQRVGPGHSREP